MLSLYLHIPFCAQKCAYCAFTSFPVPPLSKWGAEGGGFFDAYLTELKKEIEFYGNKFPGEEIKTIYIGGGTPNLIWAENIISIINEIKKYFNTESVAEYSFEFNPFPQEEIYSIIKKLNAAYAKESRVRFSFGIQSLDDEVLKSAGRFTPQRGAKSSFGQIVEFLRWLQQYKQENNVFNFDFIAFGKFNETRSGNLQLRDQGKLQFFENFVQSWFADSFSLYTLELSEWSKWHTLKKSDPSLQDRHCEWNEAIWIENDDLIPEEFQILKEILLESWYHRYEVSNFAHPSKNSIHNMTYRTMENYLWLGLASSSFLDKEHSKILSSFLKEGTHEVVEDLKAKDYRLKTKDFFGLRLTNTKNLNDYLASKRLDESKTIEMNSKDYLIEKFFLNFRTNQWIKDINEFKEILVPNYEKKIENYINQWFIFGVAPLWKGKRRDLPATHFKLTDSGMDVFNTIITDLMQEI